MISGFSTIRPDDQAAISKHVPSGASGSGEGSGGASDELQNQNTQVYEVLEALAPLSDAQVKEMLELNGYPSQHIPGGVVDKRMLCADGIVFGATQMCQVLSMTGGSCCSMARATGVQAGLMSSSIANSRRRSQKEPCGN